MIYAFEDYELDTQLYELRHRGERCRLEPQVFDVLAYLIEHHERVVTKEELLDRVWPERFISEGAITSRLMAARKAVGDNGRDQRLIRTVHGRGYRFVAPTEVRDGAPGEPAAAPAAAPAIPPAEAQQIRFCTTSDGVRIAYATVGEGPPLVKAANWLSHLEFDWRSPVWRHWIAELSRDHTYVRYDERGCGLSDWDVPDFSMDAWVRDLETVVDAMGLVRFPLLGISQGGPVAITYAVRHPERVSHLILYGTYARGFAKRAKTREEIDENEALITLIRLWWGRDDPAFRQVFATGFIPGANAEQMRWFNDLCRVSASPGNAARFRRAFSDIDVSPLLPLVSAPTLVLHALRDERQPVDGGRALAAGIPGARFVPLDGRNHILLEDEPAWPRFLSEVRQFLGAPHAAPAAPSPAVHAILFADVEGAKALTRRLGERADTLLREHRDEVRKLVSLHGGREGGGAGEGVTASFDSAVRALECAVAIQRSWERLAASADAPFRVRVAVHARGAAGPAGEPDEAATIAARITGHARGNQILVSEVVRQLVTGRGFEFRDLGSVALRGVEEPLRLHEVPWK